MTTGAKALGAFSVLLALSGPTLANNQGKIDNETKLKVASMAATCAACHNTNGKGVENAAVQGLSFLKASYIEEQMQNFKTGKRDATVMHQLSKGYTDEQIKLIANHLGQP